MSIGDKDRMRGFRRIRQVGEGRSGRGQAIPRYEVESGVVIV